MSFSISNLFITCGLIILLLVTHHLNFVCKKIYLLTVAISTHTWWNTFDCNTTKFQPWLEIAFLAFGEPIFDISKFRISKISRSSDISSSDKNCFLKLFEFSLFLLFNSRKKIWDFFCFYILSKLRSQYIDNVANTQYTNKFDCYAYKCHAIVANEALLTVQALLCILLLKKWKYITKFSLK